MAMHNLESLYFQEKMISQKVRVRVLSDVNKINLLMHQINLAKKELFLAKQVEEAEDIKFKEVESNLVLLNLREQSTAETRMSLIDALTYYHTTIADYRYVSSL